MQQHLPYWTENVFLWLLNFKFVWWALCISSFRIANIRYMIWLLKILQYLAQLVQLPLIGKSCESHRSPYFRTVGASADWQWGRWRTRGMSLDHWWEGCLSICLACLLLSSHCDVWENPHCLVVVLTRQPKDGCEFFSQGAILKKRLCLELDCHSWGGIRWRGIMFSFPHASVANSDESRVTCCAPVRPQAHAH